jgi:hypothetical protein
MTISDMIKEMRERAEDKRCMARANAQAFNTPLDETAGRFEDEAASTIEALAEALEPFANAGGKLDLMRDDVVTSIRFGLMLDVTTTVADFSRARSALNLLKGEGVTGLTPARHGRSAALRAQVLKVIEYEMEFFTPTGKQAARCILHKLDEKVFNQPRGLSASDGPSSPEAVNPKETSP